MGLYRRRTGNPGVSGTAGRPGSTASAGGGDTVRAGVVDSTAARGARWRRRRGGCPPRRGLRGRDRRPRELRGDRRRAPTERAVRRSAPARRARPVRAPPSLGAAGRHCRSLGPGRAGHDRARRARRWRPPPRRSRRCHRPSHRRRRPPRRLRSTSTARRPSASCPRSVADIPSRVYVPNSEENTVSVIDPATFQVIDKFRTDAMPHHVTPSWDMQTLYVLNTAGNSLLPIDPRTSKPGAPDPRHRSLQPLLHPRRHDGDRRRRALPAPRPARSPHLGVGRVDPGAARRGRPRRLLTRRPLLLRLLRVLGLRGDRRPRRAPAGQPRRRSAASRST